MEEECSSQRVETDMKGTGNKTANMDRVTTLGIMEISTWVAGTMIKNRVKAFINGKTEISMKALGSRTSEMATGSSPGLMEISMKAISRTISVKEKGQLSIN